MKKTGKSTFRSLLSSHLKVSPLHSNGRWVPQLNIVNVCVCEFTRAPAAGVAHCVTAFVLLWRWLRVKNERKERENHD